MIWEVDDGIREIEGLDEDGRPDPEYAASLGLRRAGFGMRALAAAIETAIFIVILVPMAVWVVPSLVHLARRELDWHGLVQHPNFVFMLVIAIATVVLVLAFALTQGLLHGKKGVSIGKAFTGIRAINVKTLEKPGFWRVTLRTLIYLASWLLPVIGPALFLVSPLFDTEKRGRGWLDLAAGTWLVDIRGGLNPYDRKRMRVARKSVRVAPNAQRDALPSLATEAEEEVAYRPGGRVSAGVIGSRRPKSTLERGAVAESSPQPKQPERIGPKAKPEPARAGIVTAVPAAEETVRALDDDTSIDEVADTHASEVLAAAVLLDDGTRHPVTERSLLGRNPAGDAELIRIPDSTRSVSKTHLRLVPAAGGLLVADAGSKNGFRLRQDGDWSKMPAGEDCFVAIGEMVRFGDRSLTVEALR